MRIATLLPSATEIVCALGLAGSVVAVTHECDYPPEIRGRRVPDILLSGHHENIRKWRKEQALRETLEKRPDLLKSAGLDSEALEILRKIENEK